MEETFYSVSELSDKIHKSRKTVWSWIRDGKLKSERYGDLHRIKESDWQACFAKFNKPKNSKA
jgi:excisionase family DNA binding protein